jgi:hypothetical protein
VWAWELWFGAGSGVGKNIGKYVNEWECRVEAYWNDCGALRMWGACWGW